MKLRIYKGDWFFNMGIVGFLNILHEAEVKNQVIINEDYIEFDSLLLENFHNHYFDYFMKEYDVSKRVENSINYSLNYIKANPEKIKESIKKIKDNLKKQNDKVKKFDEINYINIKDKLDTIGKIKKSNEIEQLEQLTRECVDILKIKSINDRLTANLYKFIVGDNYFGQVSFFNVAKSKLELEGLKQVMFNDYLISIIHMGELESLIDKEDLDSLEKYITEKLEYLNKETIEKRISKASIKTIEKIMKDIKSKFIKKKKSIEDIKAYMGGLETCEMCGTYKGLINDYSESNFAVLGVSNDNAKNMFWNHDSTYSICDICKIILFCTPAGATYTKKNYIENEDNEFYSFVNMDTSIDDIYNTNINLKKLKDRDNPFNDLVIDIVSENKEKSEWQLQNILFVEFKASIEAKKCKMNYFNMPTYLAKFFVNEKNSKLIQSIYNQRFKANVVDILLKNKDLKHLISKVLRDKIKDSLEDGYKNNISSNDIFKAIKIRALIDSYKKGVSKMNDKKLQVVKFAGHEIHDYYVNTNSKNKINGVAYKLLNAVKVGNKKDFMDTVLRVFMSAEKSVPSVFIEIMAEKDLDFESIGHAFITGLISEKYEANK
ncbi:type I-B CRISPR-associated protein Cas8b1/Cst1 [Paraclostridium bifermentans]|uniref:type I-B CRISPR-associated protein Cas8b1/Cst1 n=1 Tax=Paraclostridium bifermentans TaxID=1490 RepID=UPI001C7FABDA|nr:type I-B CRISPR-associated protein Cas8b1/Cst1 [Paraclostridium bifermentans]GIM33282.1 type I-B CRISPR-associated protein Cas8b1/Cst1 [Paraclostridium bifermentans subsp. muricolitidis]